MNKTELNEKIYAAALGCLDKKEFLLFKETNSTNPDYADKNFAIYQQLTSLLPLILDSAEPEKGIKDRIARKVYRLKDNSPDAFIDSVIKGEPVTTSATTEKIIIPPNEVVIPERQQEIIEEPKIFAINEEVKPVDETLPDVELKKEEKTKPIIGRFEKINTLADDNTMNDIVITQKKLDVVIEDKKNKKNREEKQQKNIEVIATAPEPLLKDEPEMKNKFFMILLVLISAVAMIGSAFLYIKFSSENDKYIEQINLLNSQLKVLNEEADANKKLIGLLESDDLIIINMSPVNADSASLVRILVNGNTKSGFLQTGFSTTESDNQSLSLWSVSASEKNLILTFPKNNETKFHAFDLPAQSASAEILLIITKAAGTDTTAVTDSLLYTGSFLYQTE